MLFLPSLAAVQIAATSPVPTACRVFDSVGFTGKTDLPDSEILGRVTRTSVHHHAYSSFAMFEEGVTWIRSVRVDGKTTPAIKIRFQWTWDDASGNANSGPRRNDWYLLKIRNGDVTANTAECAKPFN